MTEFLKSLRRGPGDHRDTFAEFAVLLVFIVASALVEKRNEARLRVVR